MEHYQVTIGVTLSKNYNSVSGEVTFGRDASPRESRAQLCADVESEVQRRIQGLVMYADDLLTEAVKGKKS